MTYRVVALSTNVIRYLNQNEISSIQFDFILIFLKIFLIESDFQYSSLKVIFVSCIYSFPTRGSPFS